MIAQATAPEVCEEGAEGGWLCTWLFERTANELVARAGGLAGSLSAILVILFVAYVLSRLLRRSVTRFSGRMERRIEERLDRQHRRGAITETQRFRTRRLQRLQAIAGVMRGAISAVVWLTAFLVIIARLGIPLQPLLAGAGLAGIVIGFGAQQLVRDVLAGIAMLIEDQYGVGDFIEVEGKIGAVERVGLRSTAFRDIDGTVHHVLNGSVQRVANLAQGWAQATFDVPLALDTDIPTARDVIWRVASDLVDDPVWGPDTIGPPEVWGVQELGPDGLAIRVVIPTKPLRNWEIMRQLRERLKNALEQAGIRMPARLIEIGGMHGGAPVRTRATDEEPEQATGERTEAEPAPAVAPSGDTRSEEPDVPPERDQTVKLRLESGFRPRPD